MYACSHACMGSRSEGGGRHYKRKAREKHYKRKARENLDVLLPVIVIVVQL